MKDNSHNTVSTQPEHPNYKILKTIIEDMKVKDLSMEDNISFIIASIHKRITLHLRSTYVFVH